MFSNYPPDQLDSLIATSGRAWPDYQHEMDWWTQRYLYRKLSRYPSHLQGNQLLQDFMDDQATTPVGLIAETGYDNQALYQLSPAQEVSLDENLEAIGSALDEIEAIDEDLADGATPSEEALLLAARQTKLDSVAVWQTLVGNIVSQWQEVRFAGASGLITSNSGISTRADYDGNEKIMHDLYLKTITQNIPLTLAQKDQIRQIAEQCPIMGGPAVYRAKAWYAFISGSYFAGDDCSGVQNRSGAEAKHIDLATNEFVTFPNPASSNLYIQCQAQKGGRIVLTNAVGLEFKQTNLTEGLNQISLDISTFPNGLYICHVVQDGRSIRSEKVVVFNH